TDGHVPNRSTIVRLEEVDDALVVPNRQGGAVRRKVQAVESTDFVVEFLGEELTAGSGVEDGKVPLVADGDLGPVPAEAVLAHGDLRGEEDPAHLLPQGRVEPNHGLPLLVIG